MRGHIHGYDAGRKLYCGRSVWFGVVDGDVMWIWSIRILMLFFTFHSL